VPLALDKQHCPWTFAYISNATAAAAAHTQLHAGNATKLSFCCCCCYMCICAGNTFNLDQHWWYADVAQPSSVRMLGSACSCSHNSISLTFLLVHVGC
jgi:hypothetical protein